MTSFPELFGHPAEVLIDAHGRVNLIGEHTDYNGGFVLPVLLPQRTTTELSRRNDSSVRLFSENRSKDGVRSYTLGQERPGSGWIDYVQGLTQILFQRGYKISGFDARIESNVPAGSGVSSSAALELSVLRGLRIAFHLQIDDQTLALLAQSSENSFVGAHVGIMDQMVASLGKENEALFLDTRSLEFRRIPLPYEMELVVIHSGISHQIRDGGYNRRRQECEEAARLLNVQKLRDLNTDDLPRIEKLPEPLNRRARHVVTENARVLKTICALEEKDLDTVGLCLNESHASLRDDYDVSIPEVDFLVDLAQKRPEVYGARITGGGFGGSIAVAAKAGSGAAVAEQLCADYFSKTNRFAKVLLPQE